MWTNGRDRLAIAAPHMAKRLLTEVAIATVQIAIGVVVSLTVALLLLGGMLIVAGGA